MAWLAIIYVFVAGLDVAAWFAFVREPYTIISGLSAGCAALFTVCALRLRDFAVPGHAAPTQIPRERRALSILHGLEAVGLAGRAAAEMDSHCA